MNNTVHDHASSPCLPLFSLTTSIKKAAGTSHKKVFQMKTSACRDGTFKNQPNKMGTTPQHIYTIPTSCAILPTMHNKKLSTHSLNAHGTLHCLLLSLPHKRRSIPDSATFSSSKIYSITSNSQHTMQTQHCSQFLHTRQTIPAMLNSNYIGYIVSFIPTKCFIRKKPTFRLLFCSLHKNIHSSVLCMLCML